MMHTSLVILQPLLSTIHLSEILFSPIISHWVKSSPVPHLFSSYCPVLPGNMSQYGNKMCLSCFWHIHSMWKLQIPLSQRSSWTQFINLVGVFHMSVRLLGGAGGSDGFCRSNRSTGHHSLHPAGGAGEDSAGSSAGVWEEQSNRKVWSWRTVWAFLWHLWLFEPVHLELNESALRKEQSHIRIFIFCVSKY